MAAPLRGGFERPYGWAWLLRLAQDLFEWDDADAREWLSHLAPLVEIIENGFMGFLPRQSHPIRVGTHANTAWGMTLALDYAISRQRHELFRVVTGAAVRYFGGDENLDLMSEPGGADFLSPSLCEADLMRRILPWPEFAKWLTKAMPALDDPACPLYRPVKVEDRADGQLVHLDGLNLSRAWCLNGLASALIPGDGRIPLCREAAQRHERVGLESVGTGDYMGDHWLGTFAVYLLTERAGPS